MKIESTKVTSKSIYFKSFFDKNAFVTMTEWANGEGYDITVSCKEAKTFSLSCEELDALVALSGAFNLSDPE